MLHVAIDSKGACGRYETELMRRISDIEHLLKLRCLRLERLYDTERRLAKSDLV